MNKYILFFFICFGLFCHRQIFAQTDSTSRSFKAYKRIVGDADLSIGRLRGFVPGDSLSMIRRSEKAILEAQGDDFLYYRILFDSLLSVEIAYVFDEKGLLISTGIEFFESDMCVPVQSVSHEFSLQLNQHFGNVTEKEEDFLKYRSATGMHADFYKEKDEMCFIHTEIEFY